MKKKKEIVKQIAVFEKYFELYEKIVQLVRHRVLHINL